jgi:hypothetical protein
MVEKNVAMGMPTMRRRENGDFGAKMWKWFARMVGGERRVRCDCPDNEQLELMGRRGLWIGYLNCRLKLEIGDEAGSCVNLRHKSCFGRGELESFPIFRKV